MLLNIEFDYEEEISLDFNFEDKAKQVINEALTQHNMPYDCNVSISIVSEESIQTLNKDSRGIDKVTDVISFAFEEVKDVNYDDVRFLGEIYISYERCKSQAADYGHSVRREFCYLGVHGLLHLLGYDHMEEEDKKVMRALEEEILNEYDIKR